VNSEQPFLSKGGAIESIQTGNHHRTHRFNGHRHRLRHFFAATTNHLGSRYPVDRLIHLPGQAQLLKPNPLERSPSHD